MAIIYKFRRDSTDLVLNAAVAAGLRGQQWFPQMGEVEYDRIPPYVMEEMDLRADRASDDDLATTLQALDQMRFWAAMYRMDRTVREPVWLHAKMDGETGERRAYVRRIGGNWRSNQIDTSGPAAAHDALIRLEVERHPCWERTADVTGAAAGPLSEVSVMYDYTSGVGDVAGDVPARMSLIKFIQTYGAGGDLDRIWAGIRSTKYGDPTNFVNIWECENASATAGTDCGAPTTDATASPGGAGNTKRVVNFATTADWALRLTMWTQNFTTDWRDNMGLFLWLMRVKADASTDIDIRLKYGYAGAAADTWQWMGDAQRITIDWDYYNMGQSQMPPLNAQMNPTRMLDQELMYMAGIEVWARRVAGTGSLHLDCLCPVPLDEGWLIARDVDATIVNQSFVYMQSPTDDEIGFTGDAPGGGMSFEVDDLPLWEAHNFRFPPGDGRLVTVYARESFSGLADQISFASWWAPRWMNLRGGE